MSSTTVPTVRGGAGVSVREALRGRYPKPGSTINGTYRVIEVLGEGGMGVVFRAHDERLDRDVAIKFIHPKQLQQKGARDRFGVEARAMAAVRHPNVVEVHAFGEIDDVPYFVMEYVAGPDLERWLRDRGRPSLREAWTILDQICRGVSAIHASGATHRDVKTSNILVGPGLHVAITDFGLARVVEDQEVKYSVSGTPAYMAPELIRGDVIEEAYLPRVDVYSLGVIAYEVLVGHSPFAADTLEATLDRHLSEPPPRLVPHREDLPQGFEDAVFAALAKDPGERLPSASVFRERLERGWLAKLHPVAELMFVVVDDDHSSRRQVARTLKREFPAARVESVDDPSIALALCRSHPPSALVTGLDMPGMNGFELTAALRAEPSMSGVPIIVTTAAGGPGDWSVLRRVGADAFLTKPFSAAQLVSLIAHLTAAPREGAGD